MVTGIYTIKSHKISTMPRNIRLIARLDVKGPNVIKGVHLECLRIVGQPDELAKRYYEEGADELLYLDTVASLYGRENLVDIVARASRHLFIPLTAGGGIRSLANIRSLLRAGADKVAINTWAIKNPEFITAAARSFGSQCIVGSIEAKKIEPHRWEAYAENGREPTGRNVLEWAQELETRGAGELLVTSIDQEGTRKGFDIELMNTVADKVSIPVIASGGAGTKEHVREIAHSAPIDAVAVASLLHYHEETIANLKKQLPHE